MGDKESPKQPSKCAVCDTYDFKGMWKCECDAMNLSKNKNCWKCGEPRMDRGTEGV